MAKKHEAYFEIVAAARTVARGTSLGFLDLESRAILEVVGIAEARGQKINVTELVKECGIGTPPIVYRRIAELEASGWLSSKTHPEDRRQKLVQLTRAARSVYSRIADRMIEAARTCVTEGGKS